MYQNGLRISMFLFLSLLVFSCTKDHELPVKIPAKIKTLEFIHGVPTSTFKVQFVDLGNIPITEYGIAMSKGLSGQLEPNPTVANEVLVFSAPPVDLNIKTQTYSQNIADVNYRAYARLSDGTVVYGDIIKYRFQPV